MKILPHNNHRRSIGLLLYSSLLFTMMTGTAGAQGCTLTTCTVNTTSDEIFNITDCNAATVDGTGLSFREALGCSNTTTADTVVFDPIVQGQTFTLTNGEISLISDVNVIGTGESVSSASSRIINSVTNSVVISNLNFTAGSAPIGENGGCLLLIGGLHDISDATFSQCSAFSGGAIAIDGGAIVGVTNSTFDNNSASRAGGAIEIVANAAAALVLDNVIGSNNQANGLAGGPGNGGFIHITGGGGDVVTLGGSFSGNTAAAEGGAFWNADGQMTLSDVMVNDNIASGHAADNGGGGIFNDAGLLLITDGSMIINNSATGLSGSGGGLFSLAGDVSITGASVIENNAANRAGGGIEVVDGTLAIQQSFIRNNDVNGTAGAPNPGNGGGFHVSGIADLNFINSIVSDNTAANEGGGLWNQSGSTMTIRATQVINNSSFGAGGTATNGGGGLFNNGGVVNLEDDPGPATFVNNSASGVVGSGGAILSVGGSVTASGVVNFSGNTANRAGGAIEMNGGTLDVSDSSFTNNSTPVAGETANPGNGGVLHITGDTDATFTNSSMSNNTAAREGGALWNSAAGTLTVDNSLIDSNIATGNAADDGGGGIFNSGGTLNVINNTQITNNVATGTSGSGGGIFSLGGVVSIQNSILGTNSANRAGGGIEIVAGILEVESSEISNNDVNGSAGTAAPGNGGALHVSGPAKTTINNSQISNNLAAREGGGLWNSATGGMSVANSLLIGNVAFGNASHDGGGGIFNDGGVLMITDESLLIFNRAAGTAGSGGGVLSTDGIVTMNGESVIAVNSANRAGGGIEIIDGTLNVNNGILAENDVNGTAGTPAPGNGGGLHITGAASTTFSNALVVDNVAANEGGGLWNQANSTMTLFATVIAENQAVGAGGAADDGGGGIFNNGGVLNILATGGTTNIFDDNTATGTLGSGGGLLSLGGEVNIVGAEFTSNSAIRAGGAIEMNGGTLTMTDTTMDSNALPVAGETANPGNGGALHVTGDTITQITGGSVTNNMAAREGGGLWNSAIGDMTVSGVLIDNNVASGPAADDGGGGLFNDGGTLTINDATLITNNLATGASGSGGGLLSTDGVVNISGNTLFDSNAANRAGGAIEVIVGELNVSDAVMTNNDVNNLAAGAANPGNGGAVHISGAATSTFRATLVEANQAASEGGGLWNSGTGSMTVNQSLISNNLASSSDLGAGHGGGGLFNNGGEFTVLNSTISGNTANAQGGGVLLVDTQAPVVFEFSTITDNTADTAGGISILNNAGTTPSLASTIIGDNAVTTMSTDINGVIASLGFNLIGDTVGATFTSMPSDLLDTAPVLLALADNGGPTQSHMPDATSPAIDNGSDSNCSPVDQRDFIRPVGVGCDIGSIEVGSTADLDIIFKDGFE